MQQIQAHRFQIEQVGRHVASSKKRYTWQFLLKEKLHTIVLDFSIISGKLKITVDRKVVLQNELPVNVAFQYPFTLDGFALNLIQQGETFELRLNNKVFSHLYTQQKTNQEFKKYETEVKDIQVDHSQLSTGNKKLSLNIAAFGGAGKKKKEKTASNESQGWNAFGGSSDFPNYFGEVSSQQKQIKQQKAFVKKQNLLDDDESEKTEKTDVSMDLNMIGESKPQKAQSSSLFQFGEEQAKPVVGKNASDQLTNMQQLFKSVNVSSPAVSNEVDFFAEEPKKTKTGQQSQLIFTQETYDYGIKDRVTTTKPADSFIPNLNNPSTYATGYAAFNTPASTANNSLYTTGYALFNGSQTNQKPFMTNNINPTIKTQSDLTFNFSLSQPSKIESPNFSKNKATVNTTQNIFSVENETKPAEVSLINNPLTDININDFNTMQKLFQTSNFNDSNNFDFGPSTISSTPTPQFVQSSQNTDPSFNTLQQLFTTTNYSNLNASQPTSAIAAQKPNPYDLFSANKPATFSTISGVHNNNLGLDLSNFGTMQLNASQPGQLDDLLRPVAKKSVGSTDLI